MSNTNEMQEQWTEMVEEMNDAVADSLEQNMKAQAAFVESWAEAVEDSVPEEDTMAEGIQGYNRAYEVWMDAAEQMFERTTDAAQGEDVGPAEFRDIWLQSANEAFKEVMSTSAFAAANGQLVERMMEMRREADDVSQETISQLGFPTRDDMDEVGERLVELERRQHEVEQKLDRILDHLEE
ncbi:poly(R)-hydroxyalkanoic acid synthase subunit PhaE [Halosimplex halobium]|uniref:poly(R)-hydroxyalkanoic acid synthase subunit PhaE n=1 Tax=Halosimplex halobium TaxID=3396618 RepID=UPI003F578006